MKRRTLRLGRSGVAPAVCGVMTTLDMRHRGVVLWQGLDRRDVEAGAGDASLLERSDDGGLVDDFAARHVDEVSRGLHDREGGIVQEAACLRRQRAADDDDVRGGEEVVEAVHAPEGAHLGRPVYVLDVDGDDVHAERPRPLRHGAARPAEPDDAEDAAAELGHHLAHRFAARPRRGRLEDRASQLTREGEEEGEGVVGEVLTDEALGAGEEDVARDHLGEHQLVGAGGDVVEPGQLLRRAERLALESAQRDLCVRPVELRFFDRACDDDIALARRGVDRCQLRLGHLRQIQKACHDEDLHADLSAKLSWLSSASTLPRGRLEDGRLARKHLFVRLVPHDELHRVDAARRPA